VITRSTWFKSTFLIQRINQRDKHHTNGRDNFNTVRIVLNGRSILLLCSTIPINGTDITQMLYELFGLMTGSTSETSEFEVGSSAAVFLGFFRGVADLAGRDFSLGPGFLAGFSTGASEVSDTDSSDTVRFLERV
jgi:hypothetical protein